MDNSRLEVILNALKDLGVNMQAIENSVIGINRKLDILLTGAPTWAEHTERMMEMQEKRHEKEIDRLTNMMTKLGGLPDLSNPSGTPSKTSIPADSERKSSKRVSFSNLIAGSPPPKPIEEQPKEKSAEDSLPELRICNPIVIELSEREKPELPEKEKISVQGVDDISDSAMKVNERMSVFIGFPGITPQKVEQESKKVASTDEKSPEKDACQLDDKEPPKIDTPPKILEQTSDSPQQADKEPPKTAFSQKIANLQQEMEKELKIDTPTKIPEPVQTSDSPQQADKQTEEKVAVSASFKNISIDSSTTSSFLFGSPNTAKLEKPKTRPPTPFATFKNVSFPSAFSGSGSDKTGSSLFGGGMKKSETPGSPMTFPLNTPKSVVYNAPPLFSSPKPKEVETETDQEPEEFVPTTQYKPVIPLPSLVDQKTGEENEESVFASRCKLFRFDKATKENKERGVGEIKILRHKTTGRHRCIMRRDQTLTVCANFPIVKSLEAKGKDKYPNVILWACRDYSENSEHGNDEVFSARFKDEQLASDFSQMVMCIASKL